MVCRSFKVTGTAAVLFLTWPLPPCTSSTFICKSFTIIKCASYLNFILSFGIFTYGFGWSNFLSCSGLRPSWRVHVFWLQFTLLSARPCCLVVWVFVELSVWVMGWSQLMSVSCCYLVFVTYNAFSIGLCLLWWMWRAAKRNFSQTIQDNFTRINFIRRHKVTRCNTRKLLN
jgi:hypothetical protein